MKLTFALILTVAGIASGIAIAADQPHCDQIQQACGEAGYTRNVPDGKDLMTKCFQPILKGQTIEGVKTDSDTVKKCEAEQNQKPSKGKHHRGSSS
jgi:hypothetical protein